AEAINWCSTSRLSARMPGGTDVVMDLLGCCTAASDLIESLRFSARTISRRLHLKVLDVIEVDQEGPAVVMRSSVASESRWPLEEVWARHSFAAGIEQLAAQGGRRTDEIAEVGSMYLQEMAATHNSLAINLFERFGRLLMRAYTVEVEQQKLQDL